jgi:hypothetical protein
VSDNHDVSAIYIYSITIRSKFSLVVFCFPEYVLGDS